MPVIVKFSRLLHERLGDAVANELLDWLNQVDSAFRSDLKELNELNFARFDAKLEQRLAELRGEFQVSHARLETRLEVGLREQTRFFFLAWAVLLASNIGLWFAITSR